MNQIIEHLEITGLSHDGRGIAHIDGKTCFVTNAVPGDIVSAKIINDERNFAEANLIKVQTPSENRTEPFCDKYSECGGCLLQHLSVSAQRHWKAQNFFTQLKQQLNTENCQFTDTLTSHDQAYRRRARLALEIDKKDKQARLGFRKAQDNRLVDIEHCPILSNALNSEIKKSRPELLKTASRKNREFTIVEADNGVFGFSESQQTPNYQIQPAGQKALTIEFPSNGFIQVNADINQQMITQSIEWLDVSAKDSVIDFFSGVGNFTLPLAQVSKKAIGIEGLDALVESANRNAQLNQLDNCEFYKADLFKSLEHFEWFREAKYDRVLLDPGRLGAQELCEQLGKLEAQKIVYVSCDASTLIRDCKLLQKQGYVLKKACFMDMFAHTTHGETMVLLEKSKKQKQKKAKRLENKKRIFKF